MVTLNRRSLAPPGVGSPWQATHEVALNTGPSPSPPGDSGSFGFQTRVNSALPASTSAGSGAWRSGPAQVSARTAGSARATARVTKYQRASARFMEAPRFGLDLLPGRRRGCTGADLR